jgi:hypothetical protein
MIIIGLVTAWAAVEAAIAIALMAHPARRSTQRGSIFSGLADWRC